MTPKSDCKNTKKKPIHRKKNVNKRCQRHLIFFSHTQGHLEQREGAVDIFLLGGVAVLVDIEDVKGLPVAGLIAKRRSTHNPWVLSPRGLNTPSPSLGVHSFLVSHDLIE